MKNYQPKKNNPYVLPQTLYMRMVYLIRDYDRLVQLQDDILYYTGTPDGQPHGNTTGDPTANKAIRLEQIQRECKAVE